MVKENNRINIVFLSPHLDDAVLSCGGTMNLLKRNNIPAEVITLFAGSPEGELSPLAEWMHRAWKLPYDAPARRREENRRALIFLNARNTCLPFNCSIYRKDELTGQSLYCSKDQIFGENWQNETSLLSNLTTEIQKKLESINGQIVCIPIGAGGHIDHLLTHIAGIQACAKLDGVQAIYYEDLPYAHDIRELQKAADRFALSAKYRIAIQLSEEDLRAKEEAIRLYQSQLKETAGAFGISVDEILSYARDLGREAGTAPWERFWVCDAQTMDFFEQVLQL
jgi:LmbE family N-acetylglucosaminyl deacetylase